MASLAELLDLLPVLDPLKEREEDPLSKSGAWVKGQAWASNTGKVVADGWRSSPATNAQARWDPDSSAASNWAVAVTLAAQMEINGRFYLTWNQPEIEAVEGLEFFAELFRLGGVNEYVFWVVGLDEGEEVGEESENFTLALGDRLALASYEGTLMICMKHAGVWTTLVEVSAVAPALPRKGAILYTPTGTDTGRFTDFAAGPLVSTQGPRPGSRSLLGVGR